MTASAWSYIIGRGVYVERGTFIDPTNQPRRMVRAEIARQHGVKPEEVRIRRPGSDDVYS